jgi:hypothetical protein
MRTSLRAWAVAVLAGLMTQLGGCTAMVWEDARETTASEAGVEAVEVAASAENNRVLLRYGVGDRVAVFALPVDAEGRPEGPFLYRGRKRTPQAILDEIGAGPRQEVMTARLPYVTMRDRRERECGGGGGGGGGGGWVWTKGYRPDGCDGPVVVAIAPTGRGLEELRDERKWQNWRDENREVTFPADCVVMLLPPEQPRPAADLAWARTKAALLTPVAVAADVAVVPPLLVLILILGGPRC